uniref:Uncharacterized protein n=1 Tax=Rhizophora mucronata TaxID=61149 RepID=A0A2P2IW17_RHIMU
MQEAANLAVKKRNLKLRDRELRLSHARKDSTPSKRKNQLPAEIATSWSKRLEVGSRTPENKSLSNTRGALSYQGLRASKSGVQKKVHTKRNGAAIKTSSRTQKGEKQRVGKRPAVAARKEKGKALKEWGPSAQAGKKRKLDSRTPGSSNRKKKAKKS